MDTSGAGNWVEFKEDADGNASFAGAGDLDQDRTHNAANEITDVAEAGGQAAWATPLQDAMGNVTQYPKPSSPTSSLTTRYDAWHRLAEVKEGGNTVAKYENDGLGRRIVKEIYSGGSVAETRHFFHSNEWQTLEERVDGAAQVDRQYVWGVGYVDELILRDRTDQGSLDERFYALQDANFNVTALVDINGDAWERYSYTPYGVRTILSGGFGSSYDWNIGHQGLMHDDESGLVYNRNRQLSPHLGRFMQRDVLEYVDGTNLYQYVRSVPIMLTDASGNLVAGAIPAGGAAAAATGLKLAAELMGVTVAACMVTPGCLELAAQKAWEVWQEVGTAAARHSYLRCPCPDVPSSLCPVHGDEEAKKKERIWECTVYFRAPGDTPIQRPAGCADSYTGRGSTRKEAIHAANAQVPQGCQGKGIGSYGHPNCKRIQ